MTGPRSAAKLACGEPKLPVEYFEGWADGWMDSRVCGESATALQAAHWDGYVAGRKAEKQEPTDDLRGLSSSMTDFAGKLVAAMDAGDLGEARVLAEAIAAVASFYGREVGGSR